MPDGGDPVASNGRAVPSVSTDPNMTPEERVRSFLGGMNHIEDYKGFDIELCRDHLKLISATATPKATTTYEFTVAPKFCNRLNNLHGGAAALIFDICTTTSLAPIAYRGFWSFAGVTRTLNVTYLRPAPEGTECLVESEVVHAGKRLCTIRGVMKRKSDGAVLCTCEHGKVGIDPGQNNRL